MYRLQISALAHNMHMRRLTTSNTQPNITSGMMALSRSVYLGPQQRPLKLGRLTVLHATHLRLQKVPFPWKIQGHKLHLLNLYACWIMNMRHHWQNINMKHKRWPQKPLINIVEVWNYRNKYVKSYPNTWKNQTNLQIGWDIFVRVDYIIIFDQNSAEFMTSSLG